MLTQNRRLIFVLVSVPFLLLIPLIAMQFTDQVNWKLADFLVMGVLLSGVGLVGELVWRKVNKMEYRIALTLFLLLAFFMIWAELAVGIFGTPFAGN